MNNSDENLNLSKRELMREESSRSGLGSRFNNLGYGGRGENFWTNPANRSSLGGFSSLGKPREINPSESGLWSSGLNSTSFLPKPTTSEIKPLSTNPLSSLGRLPTLV